MNLIEILKTFESKDWQISKDEVGDDLCEFDLNDLRITLIPKLKHISTGQKLNANCAISDARFSKAAETVFGPSKSRFPLITRTFRVISESIDSSELDSLIEEIVVWGKNQSVSERIRELSRNDSMETGQAQLYHLVALAILKDNNTLSRYLSHFENGDQLHFVPMIKTEMIKRALELANN